MARYDAASAETFVYTYKEGLLSAVAHDLKLAVETFSIEVDDATLAVTATFDAISLRCRCAMKGGVEQPTTLSLDDKRKIHENLIGDVLDVRRHPQIRFVSTAVVKETTGHRVEGRLTLRGRERSIAFQVTAQGDRQVAEVRLHQPDFGVKPFSAMMGALKVKPEILVRVSLPLKVA